MTSRQTEFGPEKLCLKCGEWWPETSEFFYSSPKGRLRSPCKACVEERRAETNAVKPCCVPGCTEPRYYWRYSRCRKHQQELNRKHYPRPKKAVQP